MGMFPVLSLFASNQSQLEPGTLWRPLLVILGGTALFFIVMRWLIGDWNRAGLITTFASFLFFIFGPIKNILISCKILVAGVNLESGRYYLLLFLSIILIVGIRLLLQKRPQSATGLLILNCATLTALIIPLISILSSVISHPARSAAEQTVTSIRQEATSRPDIYYIIFDMYARSDTIESDYGYDNSAFLEALRKQGFYVAPCSTSNYTVTQLSIPSALNMNYLPELGNDFYIGHPYLSEAAGLIADNAVRRFLHQYGYSFLSFQNIYPGLNITNADVYITPPGWKAKIQPFEVLLIDQTPGIILLDEIEKNTDIMEILDTRKYGSSYDDILFYLDELSRLPTSVQSPKFVYAHIMLPHPPYIFGPNGEYVGDDQTLTGGTSGLPVNPEADVRGYTNQLEYINSRIPQIVENIISRSKIPPVIIIQGDHGFGNWEDPRVRLPIMNAYYLPGVESNKLLYATITPVNTFRVVLDIYFQAQFKLLPDLNYVSTNNKDSYDATFYENQAIGCRSK
jgi:hypothetical protein